SAALHRAADLAAIPWRELAALADALLRAGRRADALAAIEWGAAVDPAAFVGLRRRASSQGGDRCPHDGGASRRRSHHRRGADEDRVGASRKVASTPGGRAQPRRGPRRRRWWRAATRSLASRTDGRRPVPLRFVVVLDRKVDWSVAR